MNPRTEWTVKWIEKHRCYLDRLAKNGKGGRVAWIAMPKSYDNKKGLPWTDVRGRYFYWEKP